MKSDRKEGISPQLWIGTSGWTYPLWKGIFYPKELRSRDQLRFYAGVFPTTEINYTFYHWARPETFRKWGAETPERFLFSVKTHRSITHVNRLKDVAQLWEEFVTRSLELGAKLGPLLLQFPPSFRCDFGLMLEFLSIASGSASRPLKLAFEFRHQSWFQDSVVELCKEAGVALVIADSSRYPQAPLRATASFVYLRFHGPGALFSSSYEDPMLRVWAERILRWLAEGHEVYAYFNNDANGCAVHNARRLRELACE